MQLCNAHSIQLNRIHTVEHAHLLIYAEIVERAYLIIYAGIVERAYLIIQWAGISGYNVISDMMSLAASLWTLDGGGGDPTLISWQMWTNCENLTTWITSR